MLNKVTSLYGGRAAEELIIGHVTTGASDDIRRATELARNMVAKYGMSKRLGAINFEDQSGNPFGVGTTSGLRGTSSETAEAIEQELRRITDRAYQRATAQPGACHGARCDTCHARIRHGTRSDTACLQPTTIGS